MNKESDPVVKGLPSARTGHSRTLTILLVGALCLVLAGWATSEMYSYADPKNADPTPLPSQKRNAPNIKSVNAVVDKMIEMAEITDKDYVYDLGCGDGRIIVAAAVQRGCHGVGFDIDPDRIAEAKENARQNGVADLVKFEQRDIFKVDLTKADVIVMYLLPWMLKDLIPQIDRCPPGVRLVSNDFWIEGVKEVETVELTTGDDHDKHFVRLYVTPLEKLPEKPKWKKKR